MKHLILVLSAFFMTFAQLAHTQDYPSRPIRMVVPFPTGGDAEIVARLLARRMSEGLGVSVIVDNMAGATVMIGSDFVAKAAPDGYTLLLRASSTIVLNPALYPKVPYDTVNDFQC